MLDFFESKGEKHCKKHKLPLEKEKYMGLGAVVVNMNEKTERVLTMRLDQAVYLDMLSKTWGIRERNYALTQIRDLIYDKGDQGSNETQRLLEEYRTKKYNLLNKESCLAFIEKMSAALHTPIVKLETCRTVLAWDLERAAFLTRVCYNVGFLTENEVWNLLAMHITPKAKAAFPDWETYAISYLVGRFFWSENPDQSRAAASVLELFKRNFKNEAGSGVWARYPLGRL